MNSHSNNTSDKKKSGFGQSEQFKNPQQTKNSGFHFPSPSSALNSTPQNPNQQNIFTHPSTQQHILPSPPTQQPYCSSINPFVINPEIQQILSFGCYYNPAWVRYGQGTGVHCDLCQSKKLKMCIGYESRDLCLLCVYKLMNL